MEDNSKSRSKGRRSRRVWRSAHPFALDLFSGCGGMTVGLKRAGFRVLGAFEIDSLAVETYRSNHPSVRIWPNDIRQVKVSSVKRSLGLSTGELDLLAACPPCEGFSSIRTLHGSRAIEDSRNDLVFQVLRFVRHLLPKTVLIENVPALLEDDRMATILKVLTQKGYSIRLATVNAADYGVPQRRKRMVLLASRIGAIELPTPLTSGNPKTVRDQIEKLPLPHRSKDSLHCISERRSVRIMDLIRSIPADGGSRADLPPEFQLECHRRCDGFKDVYGRMAWDKPAPTLTGGCVNPSKGRFLHPVQNRAITLREAALLQGLPRRYKISLRKGKMPAAELIGNALPPDLVSHFAEKIKNQIRSNAREKGNGRLTTGRAHAGN